MSALSLLCKMQPKSHSLQVVAREIALDIAMGSYAPDFSEHIAGVSNSIADTLSRRTELGSAYQLPSALQHASFMTLEPRGVEWWLTKRADHIVS